MFQNQILKQNSNYNIWHRTVPSDVHEKHRGIGCISKTPEYMGHIRHCVKKKKGEKKKDSLEVEGD